MKLTLKTFGQARELFEQTELAVNLDTPLTARQFKQSLFEHITPILNRDKAQAILSVCAIATESEILADDFVIDKDLSIALLPPVCGG
jgi:molybdopterin converting factor small subunit